VKTPDNAKLESGIIQEDGERDRYHADDLFPATEAVTAF